MPQTIASNSIASNYPTMVVSNALQNLRLNIQGSTPVERVITIQNRGALRADLDLWLEPADAHAAPLHQWSQFDRAAADLSLDPDKKIDVTLSFLIPPQAEPGFYRYEICLRSPQYPNEDIRRPQQLQVLPSAQEIRLRNEPKVTLEPATDSEHPYRLTPGDTFTLTVTVENPSRRTDRLFLHCPDLEPGWYRVVYPENTAIAAGKVAQTDGLELNPGDRGEIQLQIHPPQHAPAGHYFPTLQLSSKVSAERSLLRIVYFTLLVSDRLDALLSPTVQALPDPNHCFQLAVFNQGNIQRQLRLQAWDVERLLHYQFDRAEISLAPGEEAIAHVTVQPRRWRHRIWRLRDRDVAFEVIVENLPLLADGAESTEPQPALLQSSLTGQVLYKAQRRWLFWLLLLLFGAGTVVALWEVFVWQPRMKPQVIDFSTSQGTYQEGGEDVLLSWEITNAEKIHRIQVNLQDDSGENEDIIYDFNAEYYSTFLIESMANEASIANNEADSAGDTAKQWLPKELKQDTCFLKDAEQSGILNPLLRVYRALKRKPDSKSLKCTALRLFADNSTSHENSSSDTSISPDADSIASLTEGNYTFELSVFDALKRYEQPSRTQPSQTNDVAKECSASTSMLGNWGTLFSQQPQTLCYDYLLRDRAVLEDVIITPPDPPKIVAFSAAAAAYRVATANNSDATIGSADTDAINAETEAATSDTTDSTVSAPIRLNWVIDQRSEIQEIQLFSLGLNGAAATEPVIYGIGDGNLGELEDYCTTSNTSQLVCSNVSTNVMQVGEHIVYLRIVPKRGGEQAAIVAKTEAISIKPPLPEIKRFAVNGTSVLEQPRQLFAINPARQKLDLMLSWQVEHDARIEILPAPGEIQDSSMPFTLTLSAAPGVETIVLKAINAVGEAVSRSVVIEKTAYTPELVPPFTIPGEGAFGAQEGPPQPPNSHVEPEPVPIPPQTN